MSDFDDENNGLILDEQGKIIKPTRMRSIPLRTSLDVRKELARLYNDMRAGRTETADGTKMAYVLNILRTAIETGDLEQRIQALEEGKP